MSKRHYRSQSEWRKIIQQQAASGLSAMAFCHQQDISSKTFYRQRRLQCTALTTEQQTDVAVPAFIKITKPVNRQPGHRSEAVAVLHYQHSQLTIEPGCDVQWLARLMQVLS